VVICTDKSDPCTTETLPDPVAKQWGLPEVFGPVTIAVIPVVVGVANPHGLVKIVAVTVSPADSALSLMLNTKPTIVAFTGRVMVLLVNCEADEEVPRPTHPPLLMD
jgi:hypothetical protein